MPIGPEVPLGTILEVDKEVRGSHTERSWVTANFLYD